jgi:hypothetical protein
MKLKITILAAVFAAGMTASFAFAHGPGKGSDDGHGKNKEGKCTHVHLRGTIAPQTLGVTLATASKKLSSAAGTTVQVALGAAGQTVRIDAEGCQVVSGTSTVIEVRELHAKVRAPKPAATTTAVTTTAPATTTNP